VDAIEWLRQAPTGDRWGDGAPRRSAGAHMAHLPLQAKVRSSKRDRCTRPSGPEQSGRPFRSGFRWAIGALRGEVNFA